MSSGFGGKNEYFPRKSSAVKPTKCTSLETQCCPGNNYINFESIQNPNFLKLNFKPNLTKTTKLEPKKNRHSFGRQKDKYTTHQLH